MATITKANVQTATMTNGTVITAPLVALAYSYAVLTFTGSGTYAGRKINVACGGNTIIVTLDSGGDAEMSLLPFIRNAVRASGALNNPLYFGSGSAENNKFRGYIDLNITSEVSSAITMRVFYIFGNYAPKGQRVTDVYLDFDASGETYFSCDIESHYDNTTHAPVASAFPYNWHNANSLITPTTDVTVTYKVAWFYGGADYVIDDVNFHFRYDCRTNGVLKLRWLDTNGNINTRKFTIGGRSHGASVGDSWQRPHNMKTIANNYDFGKDEWAEMIASETITIGDDLIPTTHYDWLKTLASSAVVEAKIDGVWTRVNTTGITFECDPRKDTFAVSFSLTLPTDDVQQF